MDGEAEFTFSLFFFFFLEFMGFYCFVVVSLNDDSNRLAPPE